jgi:hypothetical protein
VAELDKDKRVSIETRILRVEEVDGKSICFMFVLNCGEFLPDRLFRAALPVPVLALSLPGADGGSAGQHGRRRRPRPRRLPKDDDGIEFEVDHICINYCDFIQ